MNSIIGILHDVHYLRIETEIFKDIKKGDKQLKAKINDNYKVGDTLILEELNLKGIYSGDWTPKEITDIDLKEDNVSLSLKDIVI
ncbi:DUF3850 domain-containing protein [Clostridium omnivorum]|nr:DUF3850 domain-containing protein [Clostridium sp. E14]